MEIAKELAQYPSGGLIKNKKLIRGHMKEKLRNVCEKEVELLIERWQSDECKQAIMKFMMESMAKKRKKSKL